MSPSPDPLTPDEIEQRQRPDGTVDADATPDPTDDVGEPLTPDEIEQQAEVGDDEDEDAWRPAPDDEPLG